MKRSSNIMFITTLPFIKTLSCMQYALEFISFIKHHNTYVSRILRKWNILWVFFIIFKVTLSYHYHLSKHSVVCNMLQSLFHLSSIAYVSRILRKWNILWVFFIIFNITLPYPMVASCYDAMPSLHFTLVQ